MKWQDGKWTKRKIDGEENRTKKKKKRIEEKR